MKIKQALENIKRNEIGKDYQVYIVKEKTKSTKHLVNNCWYVDGVRSYKVWHLMTFAKDKDKELDKELICCEVKQEESIEITLSGETRTEYHNVYYLFIDRLSRNNAGRTITTSEELIAYTSEDLKGRRFEL